MKNTLQVCYDAFMLSRRLQGLSGKTIKNYEDFLLPFLSCVGSEMDISDVSQADLNRYLLSVIDEPVLSQATRSTYIRHLKVFLTWCAKYYDVSFDPSRVIIPKMPKKNVPIYTDKQVIQILESCNTSIYWLTLRNRAILALMYDSGLRQSEICSLRRDKVFFDDNRMTVHGKGDKERTVPLGALAKLYLQAYLKFCPFEHEYVFLSKTGAPISCNAVKLFVSKMSRSLPFRFSSHKLRHNFATNYCLDQYTEHGQVDIYKLMYLLGHEDLETTQRYLHLAYEIVSCSGSISHLDKTIKKP